MANQVCHGVVHFSGHVQGVGFRYSTLRVAQGFSVTGRVENLFDGRVRLEVEGAEPESRAFVAEVQRQLRAFIRATEQRWEVRESRLRGFEIAPTSR